ncbi:DUF481 domain-containing protein [Robertkochia aurantiaca]|uniref:DUF481 domain-containing protein n=1 Tax=Robertkochia aurantiaca TaxID=2873700 RepID=UPI001CCC1693|nr:DUF481 domain-containing protein [Robertkochia sp. 3YJGBD-33]
MALCLLHILIPLKIQAQQDTLILKNQDRIIGQVKSMINGVLTIEPDYSDQDFKVTWLDVLSLRSSQLYLITTRTGNRINGSLRTRDTDSATVTIKNLSEEMTLPFKEIVFLKAIEDSFISRLDASLSIGFNFTKSNNLKQLTMRSIVSYTGKNWSMNSSFNTISSQQDGISNTRRTDANIGASYLLKDDWYISVNADFLSNTEQQLDLRVATRAVAGSYLIHSNRIYFLWASGLAWNNERFDDDLDTKRNSLEGVLGLQLDAFDIGDLNIFTSLFAYPSITQSDRLRYDFKIDLKYDLPLDFFIKIGYTQNFDSQPIADASKNDYVLQTTFGWEL